MLARRIMKRFAVFLFTITVLAVCTVPQSLIGQAVMAAATPKISLTPNAGSMNTQITVAGEGFPSGQKIAIYLGVANAGFGGQTYAETNADGNGKFSTAFVMPGVWPNGDPIL